MKKQQISKIKAGLTEQSDTKKQRTTWHSIFDFGLENEPGIVANHPRSG